MGVVIAAGVKRKAGHSPGRGGGGSGRQELKRLRISLTTAQSSNPLCLPHINHLQLDPPRQVTPDVSYSQ